MIPSRRYILLLAVALLPSLARSETFTFETPAQLASPHSTTVGGDLNKFVQTTEQGHASTTSLKFSDAAPEPFESWTYDLPFALTEGTITVWFYDARGIAAQDFTWGGSIILEDANNPSDFGAVEIAGLPYGAGGRYYTTEGSVDRLLAPDAFDSSVGPNRSVGFHFVTFTIGATITTVTLDGGTPSAQTAAPGGDKTLRLRIMAGSATDGGFSNWVLTAPEAASTAPNMIPWVAYDDITITATQPAANSHTMGFEVPGGVPEYDFPGSSFPTIAPIDNPRMNGFMNSWDTTTSATLVHAGAQAAIFVNRPDRNRSVTFDLTYATPGSEARLWFYDGLGPNSDQDKFGSSIMIESGSNPANFLAAEIWNFVYPVSNDPTPAGPNYYLTQGSAGSPNAGMLFSRIFGDRTVGWHEVVITLGAINSTMTIDGVGDATKLGPGLNTHPRIRILAGSATDGGFSNWVGLGEIDGNYLSSNDPYVYYDDIYIPITSAVEGWEHYD